jgi:hypothetical protein
MARRATTTVLGRFGAACEKLGGVLNGERASGRSKIWDSHQTGMSQLQRNTFTALSTMIGVFAATCATPATANRAAHSRARLDASQCYITG